jgi:EmrB/QacA subfamily drug resistance transporter
MTVSTVPTPRRGRLQYKWMVLSVTTIGAAMAAIDSSIVILGLPEIMSSLHSDLVTMVWVLMGYILMSTVFLALFGRMADMFGRVRMYNLGFVVFTVGSVLCAAATSGEALVGFRLVQGAGAAMLMANSMAIITEVFPPTERGRAMGINSITWAIGGIIGPVVGGIILSVASWRWIFLVNLPVGIAGTAWGYLALHELSRPARRERLDLLGTLLFSGGLICVLLALTEGISWGWASARIELLFVGFLVLEAIFIAWEQRVKAPLIDLSLFREPIFTFGTGAATLQSLSIFAVTFLLLFYLQGVKGYSPLTAAFMLLPLPVLQSVIGPLGGIAADRVGARLPATVGLVLQGVACLVLALLRAGSPYLLVVPGLVLLGLGGGLFWSPNTSAVMGAAPPRRLGIASATLATFRQCGMVTSFALALAVAAATMPAKAVGEVFLGTSSDLGSPALAPFATGMSHALLVSFVIVVAASALTLLAGDTAEARRRSAARFADTATAEPADPEAQSGP